MCNNYILLHSLLNLYDHIKLPVSIYYFQITIRSRVFLRSFCVGLLKPSAVSQIPYSSIIFFRYIHIFLISLPSIPKANLPDLKETFTEQKTPPTD
jgi:hypothetical protein